MSEAKARYVSFLRTVCLGTSFLRIDFVGFVVTYRAASGGADFAVSGDVTGHAANDRTFNATFGLCCR